MYMDGNAISMLNKREGEGIDRPKTPRLLILNTYVENKLQCKLPAAAVGMKHTSRRDSRAS